MVYRILSDENKLPILVYVQAVPVSIPSNARKFTDLETCEFKLSHSSKAALAFATSTFERGELIAAGFSPVLREAVARGAASAFSMPLCDQPLDQFAFFPKGKAFSHIIVGENPDWVFSGASLAGLISVKMNYRFLVYSGPTVFDSSSVILVPDTGEEASNIDIRRIDLSMNVQVNPEGVIGNSIFRKQEEPKPELLTASVEESEAAISRRLRRIARVN